jgi:transposase
MGRIEFIERVEKGEAVSRVCQPCGISRATGHKWIARYKRLGYDGQEEESRRPKSTKFPTAGDVIAIYM